MLYSFVGWVFQVLGAALMEHMFCGSARTELTMWCTIVVNRGLTTRVKVNRQCVLYVLYRMCGEKKSGSGVKRAKWPAVRTEYLLQCHSTSLLLEIDQTIKTCMHSVWGWVNELRVACEVWSTEVCEVSLTKNLRENQPRVGWEKSWKILRKILRGYLCSRGMSVFMALARR